MSDCKLRPKSRRPDKCSCACEFGALETDEVGRCILVLELGSHSAKLYVASGRLEEPIVLKLPEFGLGEPVFRTGFIPEEHMRAAIERLRKLASASGWRLHSAVGTSGFREAKNGDEFSELFARSFGIPIRAISKREEALNLARGFLEESRSREFPLPATIVELGGGSAQIVVLGKDRRVMCACSRPIGVHRIQALDGCRASLWEVRIEKLIDEALQGLGAPKVRRIYLTGGTVRAIADVAGSPELSGDFLNDLRSTIRRTGPPGHLKPSRRAVFPAGVVAICRVLVAFEATDALYLPVPSVGRRRLQELLAVRDDGRP